MLNAQSNENHHASQDDVRDLFKDLRSWKEEREESQRKLDILIESYSGSIQKGMNDLAEEVGDLQARLSVLTRERNGLLETVGVLRSEIDQLRAKVPIVQPLKEIEENQINEYNDTRGDEIAERRKLENRGETVSIPEENKYSLNDHEFNQMDHFDGERQKRKFEIGQDPKQNFGWNDRKEASFYSDTYRSMHFEPKLSENKSLDQCEKHVCTECSFASSTSHNLKLHIKNDHSRLRTASPAANEEPIVQSDVSGSDASVLLDNIQEGEKRHRCEHCPYETHNGESMKIHKNSVHDNIGDRVCDQCGYTASQQDILKRHKVFAHNMGDKRFACGRCSYSSNMEVNLKRHVKRVHEQIKNNVCAECPYATSDKRRLERHKDAVHNKGDKKFKCEECPYSSTQKDRLLFHKNWHHSPGSFTPL